MKRILLFFLLLVGMATAGNAQTKIIMGDMNRDETITIADVTNLVNVLLGKSEMQYITRADFGKPVTGITIDQTSLTLGEGGTATLTATVVPADAGDIGVIWTSSNPSVATVSSGNGQCELYLESYGSTKIAVIKAVMAITGLGLAEAKTLVESAPVSLGTYDAETAATYKAELEEAGATVTLIGGGAGGEVTAVGIGLATITATTVDGGYTATCTVTVFNSVVAGHECVDMGNGQLWATTNVGANSPEEYGDFFAWGETVAKTTYDWTNYAWGSSATSLTKYVTDSSYGTVDGKNILEPGDDAATANWGEGWRTPTEDEWNWLRRHCDWEWTNDYNGTGVAGYVVTSLSNSNSIFFPAAGNSEGGAGEYGYSWSSTLYYNNSFAIGMWLHPSALILGTGGEYRSAGMTVRPVCTPIQQVAVTGIELSPSSVSLELGQSFIPILTATVLPENASNRNISWTCSDETVVSFVKTGNTSGYLGAVAPGTATITATTEDGGYTATCDVTVSGVPVTGVTLDQTYLKLLVGRSYTLTATVQPDDASIKNVTWESSNEDVLFVSKTGELLAKNEGTATVTVTAHNGLSATCKVIVYYHDVADMGDGLLWATCNVGAENPWDYGDYFAWGETEPKEDYSWASYKFMLPSASDWKNITKYQTADGTTDALWYYNGTFVGDGKTELDPEDDAATVNWGEGWRMPTAEEWENLKDTNKFVWSWTDSYNGTGVAGYTVTSKAPGYVGNQIFLPAAGYRYSSLLYIAGEGGYYWSRTLYSDSPSKARNLNFLLSGIGTGNYSRYLGWSVRPVRVAE